jgi:hypothetical protein
MRTIESRKVAGYIYVFTLDENHKNVHVLNASREPVPLKQTKHGLFCRFQSAIMGRPLKERQMLIKVGYTSKLPNQRLEEWHKKCHHPIHLIQPPRESNSAGYAREVNGWHCFDAVRAESDIHHQLRQIYGRGVVQCHGCMTSGGVAGRHVEWFLIPQADLRNVFAVISYWVAIGNHTE